jgi:outer membrane receptor protein involved in Fe transport
MTGMTAKAFGATLIAVTSAVAGRRRRLQSRAPSVAELEEVVVTAQKAGDQQLHTVPLAIQVFSAEQLQDKNITSIGDLVTSIPGAFEDSGSPALHASTTCVVR